MNDEDPSAAEQVSFSRALDLYRHLNKEYKFQPEEIGKGFLVAAIHCFRQSLSNDEVSGIFYEVADDFAVRDRVPREDR